MGDGNRARGNAVRAPTDWLDGRVHAGEATPNRRCRVVAAAPKRVRRTQPAASSSPGTCPALTQPSDDRRNRRDAMSLEPGGILAWLLVGLVAGFLAGQVMKGGGYGIIGDIVMGIIGAFVGGFLFSFL